MEKAGVFAYRQFFVECPDFRIYLANYLPDFDQPIKELFPLLRTPFRNLSLTQISFRAFYAHYQLH